MGYYNDYLDPSVEVFNAANGFAVALMLFYLLLTFALSVVIYVFQSLGYYQIAKRRGIKNPWLAWVPVGVVWIMGCISDQYQYVAKGRIRNKRKALLALSIVTSVVAVAFYFSYFAVLWNIMGSGFPNADDVMSSTLLMMLFALILICVGIASTVVQYLALYDLFTSSDPKNAVLFLVLGILFSVTLPFFIFACRNKDLGMPPRKAPEQPVCQPLREPWENNPEA